MSLLGHFNQSRIPLLDDWVLDIIAQVVLKLLIPNTGPLERLAQDAMAVGVAPSPAFTAAQLRRHNQEPLAFT
jgi:hypothetical protein